MKDILLLGKKIKVEDCEIVLDYDATSDSDFTKLFQVMAGNWYHDGEYLIGEELENKGGILFSKEKFNFNVLLTIEMATILPATRDLNAVWCASWDSNTDYLKEAYVCGLNGWYDNLSGIERCGENGFYTSTSLYEYKLGEFIKMDCGSIGGHCFMYVDGKLITEICDPHPLYEGYIGISPYCTKLKIKRITVRKIHFSERHQYYEPEF